ncbi:tandem-95 repeat protein [Pseudactinotalea sp. HY160]|uniref:Ig-like domain-containing protein n=1 Tax=Pseudactinotalea sp. HY160 TaxID=2654490 RepID=UPI00128B4B18|nr:tandem-95 repeat protein [Pseudactinotalea sp. HY160]
MRERRRARRRQWVGAVVTALVSTLVVVLSLTYEGVATADVDLHNGGIWVTNDASVLVGRLNEPVGEIDASTAGTSRSLDVRQRGESVYLLDRQAGSLQRIDTAMVALAGSSVPLGPEAEVGLGENTVGVLDPRTGDLWSLPFDGVSVLEDPTATATAHVGDDASLAVADDGTVHALDPVPAEIVTIDPATRPGVEELTADGATDTGEGVPDGSDGSDAEEAAGEDAEAGGSGAEDSDAPDPVTRTPLGEGVELSTAQTQLTVVGTVPVVLAYDENARSLRLLRPDSGQSEPIDLSDTGLDLASARLQAPSVGGSEAFIATSDALIAVPLDGSEPRIEPVAAGAPAQPVQVAGCAYGAWSSADYVRWCGSGERAAAAVHEQIPDYGTGELRFRVNHDLVALNNLDDGDSWLLEETLVLVDNWTETIPPTDEQEEDEEESDDLVQEDVPLERDQENRDPVAQDDDLGIRAGSSTTLPVLANDSDADGDLLAVTDVEAVPETFGTLEPVHHGRALQLHATEQASGTVRVEYTIGDGRGGEDSATLALTASPVNANRPPVQTEDVELTVVTGEVASVDVMPAVQDPDGDPVYVVGGESTDEHDITTSPTGMVRIADRGLSTGKRTVPVRVSDGRAETEIGIDLTVLPEAPVEPEVVFDYVHGFTGQEIRVEPLRNDRDPGGRALRLAQVGGVEGATVSPRLDDGIFTLTSESPGTYYVTYTAANEDGLSAEGLVRIDVEARAERAPTAVADMALLPPGGSVLVDVLANDIDPAGAVIAVERVEPPTDLDVSITDHRVLEISSPQGIAGPTDLEYTASNGHGTSRGTVTVLPLPTDSEPLPPVAKADTVRVRAGDHVTIPVLENDMHPGGLPFELQDALVEEPGAGEIFTSQNTVRFKAPDQAGTLTAIYGIEDENGQSSSATITIHVVAHSDDVNSPPRPGPVDVRAFAGERIRIPIDLLGLDPDGDSVSVAGVFEAPTVGRVLEVGTAWLDYRAPSDAHGVDTFSYLVVDRLGATATAEIQVGIIPPPATNSPPLPTADEMHVRPGRPVQLDVLANDTDADGDQLTYGVPAFTETDGLEVEVTDGLVSFTSPEQEGTSVLTYQVTDRRGGHAQGTLRVVVSEDAPLLPPIAVDDVVPGHAIVDTDTVTMDVLANDWDPDGSRHDLTLSVEPAEGGQDTAAGGARIIDGELVAPVRDERQVLLYTVTDTDGLTGKAFVEIPGRLDTGPVLRPDLDLSVYSGEEVVLDLADVVVAPSGKPVQLADAAATVATNSDGSSPVVDDTTLRFVSAADYVGPATLTFRATDAEDPNANGILVSTITVPIQVLPVGAVPPSMRGGSLDLEAGGDPQQLILGQLSDDLDTDVDDLTYEIVEAPAGFRTEITGGMVLEAAAEVDTPPDTTGAVSVRVSDPDGGSDTADIAVRALSSTAPLITTGDDDLGDVHQGRATPIDVLANDSNPFPGEPRTITDAFVETGAGDVAIEGDSLSITPSADFVGRMSIVYRVVDRTKDPARAVEGRVRASVLGAPEQPVAPRIESVGNHEVVVSITPPSDNGAPITGYTVAPDGAGAQDCPNTTCTITGLTNGTDYTFTVTAVNEVGESPPSGASAAATPDVKPGPVAPPTLTFGDRELGVDWSPPANEGTPIREYQVQISPSPGGSGQESVTGDVTSLTWTGLTNGTAYQFRARALNEAREPGEWGPWSATEIPAGVPAAPAAPTIERVDTPAGGQIDVAWVKPFENGAAIDAYHVTMITDGAPAEPVRFDASTTNHRFEVTNGRDYAFTVVAENRAGRSDPSPASEQVRSFGRPGIPTSVRAEPTGENGRATVSWTAPGDNGQAIRQYQYSVDGGSRWTGVSNDGTIGGLTNGTTYRLAVRACNSYCGEASAAVGVSTYGPPGGPDIDSKADGQRITFSWRLPASDNGATISTVEYRTDGGWKRSKRDDSASVEPGWNSSGSIEVRVTNEHGQTTTGSASARTGANPVKPTLEVRRTRPANEGSACTHRSCAYVDIGYANLTPGETYTFEVWFPPADDRFGPPTDLRETVAVAVTDPSGVVRTERFYGYPGGDVKVTVAGGDLGGAEYSTTREWPDADPG